MSLSFSDESDTKSSFRRKSAEKVDHTYHDYSRKSAYEGIPYSNNLASSEGDSNPRDLRFPEKLHEILSNPEISHIISWMPHGRAWKIHNPKELEGNFLPHYFKHKNFSSFSRQINGWGFKRITYGVDANSYYNELFLRGHPQISRQMIRLKVSKRKIPNPQEEPNFYAMSYAYPSPCTDIQTQKKSPCCKTSPLSKHMTSRLLLGSSKYIITNDVSSSLGAQSNAIKFRKPPSRRTISKAALLANILDVRSQITELISAIQRKNSIQD